MGSISSKLRVHAWDHSWIHTIQYQEEHGGPNAGLELKEDWLRESGKRIKLPEVAIQTSAGCPSPKKMSEWRVKALHICLLQETQGYLTRKDIKDGGVDAQRWTQYWLLADGQMPGPSGRLITKYIPKPGTDYPSFGYEAELAVLRERAAS